MLPTVNPAEKGPLIRYLETLAASERYRIDGLEAVNAIKVIFATPEGKTLLELMQKSIVDQVVPTSENTSALAARNAQAFIAHDLRRIVSNELDALFERHEGDEPRGRKRRR